MFHGFRRAAAAAAAFHVGEGSYDAKRVKGGARGRCASDGDQTERFITTDTAAHRTRDNVRGPKLLGCWR